MTLKTVSGTLFTFVILFLGLKCISSKLATATDEETRVDSTQVRKEIITSSDYNYTSEASKYQRNLGAKTTFFT